MCEGGRMCWKANCHFYHKFWWYCHVAKAWLGCNFPSKFSSPLTHRKRGENPSFVVCERGQTVQKSWNLAQTQQSEAEWNFNFFVVFNTGWKWKSEKSYSTEACIVYQPNWEEKKHMEERNDEEWPFFVETSDQRWGRCSPEVLLSLPPPNANVKIL